MKQTAVELLVEKMENLYYVNFEKSFLEEIEQAKEIEKEQIGYSLDDLKEAYGMGRTNATIKDFNEQFKKK